MKQSDVNAVTPRYRRVLVRSTARGSGRASSRSSAISLGPLDVDIVLLRVVSPVVTEMNEAVSQIIIDDMAARTTEARKYLATIAPDLMGRGTSSRCRPMVGVGSLACGAVPSPKPSCGKVSIRSF
jgi:hypothetical protein